jgi:lactoylglutathione lyase
MSSQNIKEVTPFFMVRDIRRSLEFYVNGLGFRVMKTWEPAGQLKWCWLQREGASLMLQEHGEETRYKE